jgi:hypothetical protein
MWNDAGLALYAGDFVLRVVQAQHVTTVQGTRVADDDSVAVLELSADKVLAPAAAKLAQSAAIVRVGSMCVLAHVV